MNQFKSLRGPELHVNIAGLGEAVPVPGWPHEAELALWEVKLKRARGG